MLGIFLDTETNGLNPFHHKVIEIAFKIIDLQNGVLKEEYHTVVYIPPEKWAKSDPASLKVNGFTWEEVARGKTPHDVGEEITRAFKRHGIQRGKAVFICQNPSFDRAFFGHLIDPSIQEALLWPYHWLDLASMYWSSSMRLGKQNPAHYPWETGITKDRIALAHQLPKEAQPHRALNGVNHLLQCYEAVVGFPHK